MRDEEAKLKELHAALYKLDPAYAAVLKDLDEEQQGEAEVPPAPDRSLSGPPPTDKVTTSGDGSWLTGYSGREYGVTDTGGYAEVYTGGTSGGEYSRMSTGW
jgi:hypothetical protein